MTRISVLRRITGALLLSLAILTSFTVGATAAPRRFSAQIKRPAFRHNLGTL
jgi:hypothetical protein